MRHNLLRRMGALLLAFALVLPMVFTTAWAAEGDGESPATTLSINDPGPLDRALNPTGYFTAAISGGEYTASDVLWYTSDPSVIAVTPATGRYTLQKAGEVIITASIPAAGATATLKVTVTDASTFTAKLTARPSVAQIGEPVEITAEIVSPNNSAQITRWAVTGGRATVTSTGPFSALFTAEANGNYTVTATVNATGLDGKPLRALSVTCSIRVADLSTPVTSVTLNPASLTLTRGATRTLTANIQPPAANLTPVYWTSDNPAVASVDQEGTVTARNPGVAHITANAGGQEATCTVNVMGTATGVEFNVNANVKESTDSDGWVTQFNAVDSRTRNVSVTVLSASSATNTYIQWSSSDTSIVTVTPKSGTTTADLALSSGRRAGRATITAMVYDSTSRDPVMQSDGRTPISAKLEVTVSGIALSETAVTMYEGASKTIMLTGYGEAVNDTAATVEWRTSDGSIASSENGSLNAWNKGTATVTAVSRINQQYTSACAVTVVDDPGGVVSAGSASAGNAVKLGTSSLISQLNSVARQRTGANMDYITGIFITPAQGVVYNTYTSEADTGAGVSMSERYYVNRATPASEYVGALSFVPSKTYSGEVRISYTGYSSGQPLSGVITVNVAGMGEGTGDVTYTSNAAPVTFLAEDFNIICGNKTGRTLKYVTFTPPDASRGTLYENYINDVHPGQKVVASTQYNRTGTPSISSVTFVPAEGYTGTVTISYRAVDAANSPYTGKVTITVNASNTPSDPADIYYTTPLDGWATFRAADFANASLRTIGETLSHVRFTLPPSSDGTLFYNYRGFSDYESDVASTTSYYTSGNPALGGVTYVPATTASGQSVITYTGYSTRGTTFTGKIYVTEGTGTYQPGGQQPGSSTSYNYTVNSGSAVNLNANDFNNACLAATGASLNYIRFTSLPTSGQGTLRYRAGTSTNYSNVTTSTSFYRTSTVSGTPLISGVSFLASASYTGVVTLPYTGYSTNGSTFTGAVTIQVNPNTIVYAGSTANPLRLSSSRIRTAVSDTFSRDLSYIEFTRLPGADAGRLYLNYSGYGTGSPASTGVKYYVSGNSGIDQISFVPRARYTGDATASYTAYSTSGEKMTGQITFRISTPSGSNYFSDLYGHTWAAASVDYLYMNGVTNGITATTYGPNQPILRRDFVLMLYRAFHFSGGSAANPGFADVPANSYYAQAVSAAKQLGIVSGDGRNFMPNSQVTRQDAMVMIVNAMKAAGKLQSTASTSVLYNFSDGSLVSGYAQQAVSTLVQMGAVNGSNGRLNPHSSITRAEMAVVLHFVMTA